MRAKATPPPEYQHGDFIRCDDIEYVVLAKPYLDKTDRFFKVRACRVLNDRAFELGRIETVLLGDEKSARKGLTNHSKL